MSRSKTSKSVGSKLEELINVRPINSATKKDVAGVNYLVRKNLMTTDEVVKEAIATNNPTIMWMVARFVDGITEKQESLLNLVINNSSEKVLYQEVSKNNNNDCVHLSPEELKVKKRHGRIKAILNQYNNVSIEELFRLRSAYISDFKKVIYIINHLLRKGITTTGEVVKKAISSNNVIIMRMVAHFGDGITEEQKMMLNLAINKVNIKELIVFSPVTMHASKRDVIAINYLLHEGLKTIDEVVKETINSHNPLVMYYVALFVDGITDDHLQMIIEELNNCEEPFNMRKDIIMQNLARKRSNTVSKLSEGVIKNGNVSGMVSFANVENAPIKELGNSILENANTVEDAEGIYYFVRDHLEELSEEYIRNAAQKVIELKNLSVICSFAKFGGATILEYATALIKAVNKKQENAVYLYLFALENIDKEGFPEEEIIEELINTNSCQYIFRSARDIGMSENGLYKLVGEIAKRAAVTTNNKWKDYLASLALSESLSAAMAVEEIIKLKDPIMITFILQNCKNEELVARLQEGLNNLPCLDGESLNENGIMEMPLLRRKTGYGLESVIVES